VSNASTKMESDLEIGALYRWKRTPKTWNSWEITSVIFEGSTTQRFMFLKDIQRPSTYPHSLPYLPRYKFWFLDQNKLVEFDQRDIARLEMVK